MVICRYILIVSFFIFWIFIKPTFADFNSLKNLEITSMDFLLTKFDNFLIKNQHKLLTNNPLRVRYQSINYNVIYNEGKNIKILIKATMDRNRYNKIKYFPKNVDCNIVRNIIFYDKMNYSAFRRKLNYALGEDEMREILKVRIYNLENLDEDLKNFLINNTKIDVTISNPILRKRISCSGNLTDLELR